MRRFLFIVVSLATLSTIFVTACGDNPKKDRIMPDYTQEFLSLAATDKDYISGKGQGVRVLPEEKKLQLSINFMPIEISIKFHARQKRLKVSSKREGYFTDIVALEESDAPGISLLVKRAEQYARDKQAAIDAGKTPPPDPFEEPMRSILNCTVSKKLNIAKITKRPEDLSVPYKDYGAIEAFRSNKDTQYVITPKTLEQGSDMKSELVVGDKNSVLAQYLKLEIVKEAVDKQCEEARQYVRADFSSFFPGVSLYDNNYYSDYASGIGVSVVNQELFKIISNNELNELSRLDELIYSVKEFTQPVDKILSKHMANKDYISGTITYNGEKSVRKKDVKNIVLKINWQAKTLKMSKQRTPTNPNDYCEYEIEAKILSSQYSNRRQNRLKDSADMLVEIQQYDRSTRCYQDQGLGNEVKVGDTVKALVQPNMNQGVNVLNASQDLKIIFINTENRAQLGPSYQFIIQE